MVQFASCRLFRTAHPPRTGGDTMRLSGLLQREAKTVWMWIRRWQAQRDNPAVPRPALTPRPLGRVSGKYRFLYEYLENRYADVVVLTFSQIEDLLGFALPDLARSQNEWWTRAGAQTEKSPCSDAWVLAGRTAAPNLTARTVAFERVG